MLLQVTYSQQITSPCPDLARGKRLFERLHPLFRGQSVCECKSLKISVSIQVFQPRIGDIRVSQVEILQLVQLEIFPPQLNQYQPSQ